jgi:hypothetical protein
MDIKTPKDWRKGQTIFNFLWWLHAEKEYRTETIRFNGSSSNPVTATGRMADPFHIPDAEMDKLYEEFLSTK